MKMTDYARKSQTVNERDTRLDWVHRFFYGRWRVVACCDKNSFCGAAQCASKVVDFNTSN
jgi:hypothetical protein